jgi:signal transduction histidine kinase
VGASRAGLGVTVAEQPVRTHVQLALAGQRSKPGSSLLPWDRRPLVLAEPVFVDGEVRGAVVTISPTDRSRDRVLWQWDALGAGGVLVLGLAVLLALPVVRWVLRPVRRLDEATGQVVAAVASGEHVAPVGGDSGPPELRRLTHDFDQMAAAVSDMLAAQRAFAADASHQLRNPLTALLLRLNNLEGRVADDAVAHHVAAVAETDRLKRILDELLVLARAESHSLDPVYVDVDAVLAERVAAWRVVAEVRAIELIVDEGRRIGDGHGGTSDRPRNGEEDQDGDGHVVALVPPRSLDGVLDALLDNALKFTGEGSRVDVGARREAERVVVSVRDHGPGLKPEELARATDRFWRSPAHQNVPGSGLGLAIVRLTAERVGGAVRIDLPGGGGLRVTVELPAAPLD